MKVSNYRTLEEKAEKLIRLHRQNVFTSAGNAHTRAILRIKKTKIWQSISKKTIDLSDERKSNRFLRMYS